MTRYYLRTLLLLTGSFVLLNFISIESSKTKKEFPLNWPLQLDTPTVEQSWMPSGKPDRIILNLTETPEKSIAINWRTDTTVKESFVEWTLASSGPDFVKNTSKLSGKRERFSYKFKGEPRIEAHYFSAVLENLKAGQKYVYRVGNNSGWSEWFQFQVASPNDKISFAYFGDAQNNIKSMWSRVVREAYKTMPRIDFMLHAGDLINHFGSDFEWAEWFYAGNFLNAMVPNMMTPGNHEYGKGVVLSPQWRPQFNLPTNGPKGLEETCYVVNYSNLKVISLDAEQIDESPAYLKKQAEWLDSVLTNDPRKWTAITFHYPVFSTKPNRDNEKLRNNFKPIFDKHKVDIVLQGHDHAYARGSVSNVSTGERINDAGTVYVVSVSGPKMYEVENAPWMKRRARNTQLFQIITIEDNKLSYQAFTASGELYDAFDLIKSKKKKSNKLIERVPATPERL